MMGFDRIGLFTDSHKADVDSTDRRMRYRLSGPRFYSEADDDIEEACTEFNNDCDVVVEIGDFNDLHSDNSVHEDPPNTNTHNTGAEGEAILAAVETSFATFTGPRYHVIGNWDMYDFDFQNPADWFKHIRNGTRNPETITEIAATTYNDMDGNSKAARYYAFECPNGTIGIVLDTTGKSADDPEHYANEDTAKSVSTSYAYIPATQRTWLENTLAAHTGVPIVVFCHYWLYPDVGGYFQCINASAVRAILEAYNTARIAAGHKGRVLAVFSGHHHPGTKGWWRDVDGQDPVNFIEGTTDPEGHIFGVEHNGIKYFNLRGQIVGWGADSGGATDDGSGGEATPANSFYKAIVGEFVKDVYDIKVIGYGANPIGESKSSQQYFLGTT